MNVVEETNREFLCTLYGIKPVEEFDNFVDWSDIESTKKVIESALKTSRNAKKKFFRNFA